MGLLAVTLGLGPASGLLEAANAEAAEAPPTLESGVAEVGMAPAESLSPSAAVVGVCGNVTPNFSFESPSIAGWSSWQGSVSRVPLSEAPDGGNVARVAPGGESEYSLELDPAVASTTAGVAWYAAAYVQAASPSAVGKHVWFTVRERDSSGATVKRTGAGATLTGSFQRLSVQAPAVSSGDRLDIYIRQEGAVSTDAFYADAVTLTTTPPGSCTSPEPEPTPTPEPVPAPEPSPEPAPEPSPEPAPAPEPQLATFGKTSVGASSDHFTADTKRANRFALGQAAKLSKLSVYLQPTSASGRETIEGFVYRDSEGSPGSLVATTSPLTFSSGESAGWYDLSFASAPTLAPGNYWMGTITGGTNYVIGFRYDSVAGARVGNEDAYSNGPSST
ncbi:MAG: hypothetical protein ACTHM1_02380, partial [Solirubrobacteraceae bacterium]